MLSLEDIGCRHRDVPPDPGPGRGRRPDGGPGARPQEGRGAEGSSPGQGWFHQNVQPLQGSGEYCWLHCDYAGVYIQSVRAV